MDENMKTLIKNYKTGNRREESLMQIIERMLPLIKKYARDTYFLEYDDIQQELTIAVIESANKITKYESEAQCIQYFINGIKNKFYELYRIYKKRQLEQSCEISVMENMCKECRDCYEEIEFLIDLSSIVKCNSERDKKIMYNILFNDVSDKDIAKSIGVSRQYLNRYKKTIFSELKKY